MRRKYDTRRLPGRRKDIEAIASNFLEFDEITQTLQVFLQKHSHCAFVAADGWDVDEFAY